jgi:phosphoglycolate phosphatase
MTRDLRLVIFDVDGTLVDSQAAIWAAMQTAYAAGGHPVPARDAVLGIVGLSLPQAFATLSPELDGVARQRLATAYGQAYAAERARAGAGFAPFFPGAREMLEVLRSQSETLLAVATGKSRRGLSALIEVHGLEGMFLSTQTADDHPSKPHPAMVRACLAKAGVDARNAAMIGDTRFDMEMARAAGVSAIGVGWGYHPPQTLDADAMLSEWTDLPAALDRLLEPAA